VSRALALSLAMAVLAILLATPHIDTQAQNLVEVAIRWTSYIDPTDGRDIASGTCVFGDYIAVVGEANWTPPYLTTGKPYVVLLHKSDGGVAREWIDSENGAFFNCISIGGKLYAIGATSGPYGAIYVFDENLNILTKVMSENHSGYFSLAYDGKALYLGGWAYEDVDGDRLKEPVWLVEKRALDTNLSLVNSKKVYSSSWKRGWIDDIGVEPSTGRIWAVGHYEDSNDILHSLIIVFDIDLRELKILDYPVDSEGYLSWLYGVAFDNRYVYILGGYGVAKFSVDGELVAINKYWYIRPEYKIIYGYNYLYTFGQDRIGGYMRHILYIHDTDLNLVKSYVLSENVNAGSYFRIGRPSLEGNNVYVAGIDYARSNSRVVVYSLSIIEGASFPATEAIATTVTTATNMATTMTTTVPNTTTMTATTTATEVNRVTVGVPVTAATATIEEVERAATVGEPRIATLIITKAQTTITDRMTTTTKIGLIIAGTLLAITTLLLRKW